MPRAQGRRHLPGRKVPGKGVLLDGHLAVQHPDVHHLPQAAPGALLHRRQNADDGEEAGCDVALGHAGTNGRPARLAGDAQYASHALNDHVQSGLGRVRTVLPEAGDGGVDYPRVAVSKQGVVQAKPLHCPRREVLKDNVRIVDQLQKEFLAPGLGQVDGKAHLAAVDAHKVGTFAVDEWAA